MMPNFLQVKSGPASRFTVAVFERAQCDLSSSQAAVAQLAFQPLKRRVRSLREAGYTLEKWLEDHH